MLNYVRSSVFMLTCNVHKNTNLAKNHSVLIHTQLYVKICKWTKINKTNPLKTESELMCPGKGNQFLLHYWHYCYWC